jgi:hypothetical protein
MNCLFFNQIYLPTAIYLRFNEHTKAINYSYIRSNFKEDILSTVHNYTNIQINLQTSHKTQNGPKLNIQISEIYGHCKTHRNDILND